MTTKAHSLVSVLSRHPIPKFEYANAAARTGATGFVATDLSSVAHQQDNDTYWILIATTPTWLQLVTASGAGFTPGSVAYAGGAGSLVDDGVNFSYAAGVLTLASGLSFTGGGTISTTANGLLRLVPNGTGYTAVGSGSTTHGLNDPGDLLVSRYLEVDGNIFFNAPFLVTAGNSRFNSNVVLEFGNGGENQMFYATDQNPDAWVWGIGTTSRNLILCEAGDQTYDFAHAQQGNPTLWMQSSNQSATEWGSICHDQTDFVIDSGTDLVKLPVGLKHNLTTVNAATYDLVAGDYVVHVTYTATGAVTSLTLPTAQAVSGRVIHIKDAAGNAATNNITIDTGGSENIDGSATLVLNTDYAWVSLYSDGSDWFAIGG